MVMSKKRYKILFDKSISAALSSIELYNKPDFKYREESFVILLANGWELLLKSKILKESNNKLTSLYYQESRKNKDGNSSKKKKYATNPFSRTKRTIDVFKSIEKLKTLGFSLEKICIENLEAILEIRNNAIHLCNSDKLLNKKIQELGTASLKNYLILAKKWFNESLDHFNFYLMPISFFTDLGEVDGVGLSSPNQEAKNLTKYLAEKEQTNPYDQKSEFNLSVKISLNLVKSDTEGLTKIKYTKDENAPTVFIKEEDKLRNYPLNYESMVAAVKNKIPSIVINKNFHDLKKNLEKDQKICLERFLNPSKKNGLKTKFYSHEFVNKITREYEAK